jgi:hypothetical protein
MAFDMYMGRFCRNILRFGYRVEKIDFHEERSIFGPVYYEEDRFPALEDLHDRFYDGPVLKPEECKLLADELLDLKSTIDDQQTLRSVERIRVFFLLAHNRNKTVYCHSD